VAAAKAPWAAESKSTAIRETSSLMFMGPTVVYQAAWGKCCLRRPGA
jgi:hypothetical protein